MPTYLLVILGFLSGFGLAWIWRTFHVLHLRKEQKRTEGLLESERLVKENLRRENAMAFQLKEAVEADLGKKLDEANEAIYAMDQDMLLLQKSNEETEALFAAGMPELHNVKMQLIEANNTIARLKAQLRQKEKAIAPQPKLFE
jgi:hypothetical protein